MKPKLGKYAPVVEPAKEITEAVLSECSKDEHPSVIIHREIISRLAKAFEILEYVGFISKRESSKAMKSGGRGSRYAVNLCMLFEKVAGTRLTADLYRRWKSNAGEPLQLHIKGSAFSTISMPDFSGGEDPEILDDKVEQLRKAPAYPFGLSEKIIERLKLAGIHTIRELDLAADERLDDIGYIGPYRIRLIRNAVAQAIWL